MAGIALATATATVTAVSTRLGGRGAGRSAWVRHHLQLRQCHSSGWPSTTTATSLRWVVSSTTVTSTSHTNPLAVASNGTSYSYSVKRGFSSNDSAAGYHVNGSGGDDDDTPPFFDVLICGGGVVGCTLARSLNKTLPNLQVGLLEARDFNPPRPTSLINKQQQESAATTTTTTTKDSSIIPHPRSYALSPMSLQLLGETTLEELNLGYYTSMQIWQANSPASLTFTTRDLHVDPSKAPYLGAVVDDNSIVASLWYQIQDTTKCYTNTSLTSINSDSSPSSSDYNSYDDSLITVTTNHGQKIQTSLLVGADGGNSWIRKTSGISRIGTEYNQHALTFTVELEEKTSTSQQQRAFQRFLPDGSILALLPTYSTKHAIIVWSTSPSNVTKWKEENDESALIDLLNEYLMEGPQRLPPLLERDQQETSQSSSSSTLATIGNNLLYGAERVVDTVQYGLAMASHHPNPKFYAPPKITKVVSSKFSFPLSCYQSQYYTASASGNTTNNKNSQPQQHHHRIALIGDAAHTVHPMAGQGLNLGLGDVSTLVECISKASNAGMDVSTFLQDEYGTLRHQSVSTSLVGIHTLQRLFNNQQHTILQHVKTFGMNVIQNVSPLRRQIVQAAAYGI